MTRWWVGEGVKERESWSGWMVGGRGSKGENQGVARWWVHEGVNEGIMEWLDGGGVKEGIMEWLDGG